MHVVSYISPLLSRGNLGGRRTWGGALRSEITPAKDSHTRIKLLALASGHGRHTPHVRYTRTGACVLRWDIGIGIAVTYQSVDIAVINL